MLQATSAVLALATILWFIGVPSLRFAEAANVTTFSDTLSDSAPNAESNHTISFVTPTGLTAGDTISIDFGTTSFRVATSGLNGLLHTDVDLIVNGAQQNLAAVAAGATYGVSAAGTTLDITSGSATIGSNATVTIRIGTNATHQATGANQIINPSTGSYELLAQVGNDDSGATRVAIVDSVTVTASVQTIFDFTVDGVGSNLDVNGANTTASTTPTAIPFGTLIVDDRATAAQDLTVETNAANGFVVTVHTDQQLTSSNGADIDGFADGAFFTTPTVFGSPSATIGDEDTYGHWGLTSTDPTLTTGLTDLYGSDLYVSASSTPVEVFRHNGPVDGTGNGVGTTRVGYSVEISALQEAGNDYTATLTYVATPTF